MGDQHALPTIRASEIEQLAFCARSWWLGRVKRLPSSHIHEVAAGTDAHRAHGRVVMRSSHLQRVAHALLALRAGVAALWLHLLVESAS